MGMLPCTCRDSFVVPNVTHIGYAVHANSRLGALFRAALRDAARTVVRVLIMEVIAVPLWLRQLRLASHAAITRNSRRCRAWMAMKLHPSPRIAAAIAAAALRTTRLQKAHRTA